MNDKNILYEEFGRNYRFFLTWRYGVFAAYFVLIWGTLNLSMNAIKIDDNISGLILVIASIISPLIWIADCRTRDIYRRLTEAGKEIEKGEGGAYTTLNGLRLKKFTIFSQSVTIDGMFLITLISFFSTGFILLRTNLIQYNAQDSSYIFNNNIDWCVASLGILIPALIGLILIILRRPNSNKRGEVEQPGNITAWTSTKELNNWKTPFLSAGKRQVTNPPLARKLLPCYTSKTNYYRKASFTTSVGVITHELWPPTTAWYLAGGCDGSESGRGMLNTHTWQAGGNWGFAPSDLLYFLEITQTTVTFISIVADGQSHMCFLH